MTLTDRWSGLLREDLGISMRRGRIGAETFGSPATTWTTAAGVMILALTGGCHPPVLVGKSGFKLKAKAVSPHPKERI